MQNNCVFLCVFFQLPITEGEWLSIADEFMKEWQFPNCLGAIDGKLVHVQRPTKCGAQYFSYKRTFSVNMMAVVNAHYEFVYVTVGAQGSANDAAVFNASSFSKALENVSNPLAIPPARCLPNIDIAALMVFVADDAYPLRCNIMKPFSSRGLSTSERIFNYRLSTARRMVENAFGILVSRFRILRDGMQLQPDTVSHVVLACCVLHNFLRRKVNSAARSHSVGPQTSEATQTVDFVNHVPRVIGAHYNASAKAVRDKLAGYFVNQGQITFRWKHANIACC